MLLTQNYQQAPTSLYQRQYRPQHFERQQQRQQQQTTAPATPATVTSFSPRDFDFDVDQSSIASSSPQSILSRISPSQPDLSAATDSSMLNTTDLMPSDTWMGNSQLTPRSTGRLAHYRESSLSSLGSAGPASPFSQSTSNPQIAVTDSMTDSFSSLPAQDDFNHYQLAKALPSNGNDGFYANYSSYGPDSVANAAYSNLMAAHKPKLDRGLLPHRDILIGQNRSRPVSVASSIASDSPATPPNGEPDEDMMRRKTAMSTIPKLDRTMTDIYSDELYSPSFTITSAPPPQMAQTAVSPSNDVFAQRLQAANSQHLSAAHSPVSRPSRDLSPFRNGSPLAPTPSHNFGSSLDASSRMRFSSAQQTREQKKAEQDARAFQQQMNRGSDNSTPQTISPKDAMLEFREPEGEANFPLFPQQDSTSFNVDQVSNAMAAQVVQSYDNMPLQGTPFNFGPTQMPGNVQIPQQYPFVSRTPQQRSNLTTMSNASMLLPSGDGSPEASLSDSRSSASPQRPTGTSADGGTYTCTYHGCMMRFESPALLQKHKREGHRATHSLTGSRRPEAAGMTSSLLNTQAGPHRCDRINPSTGKPCKTVFSRPYDLTRHEDTIHNARKQKVRCDLCTEEKTFSRADALTRHYRVCHPDVEFPGKHRRRGGSN